MVKNQKRKSGGVGKHIETTKKKSKGLGGGLDALYKYKLNKDLTPQLREREKTVFIRWEAPERITYDRELVKSLGFVSVLIFLTLYLLWVGQVFLALSVIVIFFVYYAITTTPASKVVHQIELFGVRSMDKLYLWENLRSFWFAEKDGHLVLYIDTSLALPTRLFFIIDDKKLARDIALILVNFIPYRVTKERQGWFDRFISGTYVALEEILQEEDLVKYFELAREKDKTKEMERLFEKKELYDRVQKVLGRRVKNK